tara:strand:+ start:565 stop:717 length:153 start_codon:yes stop_codon:yes gene_type:complete
MFDILKELMSFLIQRKKFWLIPLVFVLVLIGAVLVVGQGSTLSPFIYTIF